VRGVCDELGIGKVEVRGNRGNSSQFFGRIFGAPSALDALRYWVVCDEDAWFPSAVRTSEACKKGRCARGQVAAPLRPAIPASPAAFSRSGTLYHARKLRMSRLGGSASIQLRLSGSACRRAARVLLSAAHSAQQRRAVVCACSEVRRTSAATGFCQEVGDPCRTLSLALLRTLPVAESRITPRWYHWLAPPPTHRPRCRQAISLREHGIELQIGEHPSGLLQRTSVSHHVPVCQAWNKILPACFVDHDQNSSHSNLRCQTSNSLARVPVAIAFRSQQLVQQPHRKQSSYLNQTSSHSGETVRPTTYRSFWLGMPGSNSPTPSKKQNSNRLDKSAAGKLAPYAAGSNH